MRIKLAHLFLLSSMVACAGATPETEPPIKLELKFWRAQTGAYLPFTAETIITNVSTHKVVVYEPQRNYFALQYEIQGEVSKECGPPYNDRDEGSPFRDPLPLKTLNPGEHTSVGFLGFPKNYGLYHKGEYKVRAVWDTTDQKWFPSVYHGRVTSEWVDLKITDLYGDDLAVFELVKKEGRLCDMTTGYAGGSKWMLQFPLTAIVAYDWFEPWALYNTNPADMAEAYANGSQYYHKHIPDKTYGTQAVPREVALRWWDHWFTEILAKRPDLLNRRTLMLGQAMNRMAMGNVAAAGDMEKLAADGNAEEKAWIAGFLEKWRVLNATEKNQISPAP